MIDLKEICARIKISNDVLTEIWLEYKCVSARIANNYVVAWCDDEGVGICAAEDHFIGAICDVATPLSFRSREDMNDVSRRGELCRRRGKEPLTSNGCCSGPEWDY